MGVVSNALPGHLPVSDAGVRDRLGKLWGVQPPAEPGLTYQQMLEGGVRGLFVMEADPAASPRAAEELRKVDFLVVQDLFLTETARQANVVFPATTWAESNGTYTNLERRIQRAPDGIDSIENCLPGWAIMTLLAERWIAVQQPQGPGESVADWKRKKRARAAAKAAPAPKPWTYQTAQAVLEEISKAAPIYGTLRWENLTDQGQQWPASALVRPPRRVEPLELQPVPGSEAGQFTLVSGPVLWDGGVLMQYSAAQVRNLMPQPFVALNPADMTGGGYKEGHLATVTSPLASATLTLCADASVQPGTAWVPYGLTGSPAETLGAGRGEPVAVFVSLDHSSLE
jgi:predicted molibdopterin-dependent oxidoreductase YjgC